MSEDHQKIFLDNLKTGILKLKKLKNKVIKLQKNLKYKMKGL